MARKLRITRTVPRNPHVEVYIDQDTFERTVSYRSDLMLDYFQERVCTRPRDALDHLARLTQLVRRVYGALLQEGVDLLELTSAVEMERGDVQLLFETAERIANQKLDIDKVIPKEEGKRLAVLRVCYASDACRRYIPDWLRRYADGEFKEEAEKEGHVVADTFAFYVEES